MYYANAEDGSRITATPGARAACPVCDEQVHAKCGEMIVWHWAHINLADCDTWAESIGAWHRGWQEVVPPGARERVIGRHRADMITRDRTVVELQHSSISAQEIREREAFYGRMIWIFDASEAQEDGRISLRHREGKPYVSFRWKHPRRSVAACERPVWLDLGDGALLHIGRIDVTAPCGGWGRLARRSDMETWMNTGAAWNRTGPVLALSA